jgi:hypothetical protein
VHSGARRRAIRLIQFRCLVYDAILLASWQRITSRTENMSVGVPAYMREYRKRKRIYIENIISQAGKGRAACMRECRKRIR